MFMMEVDPVCLYLRGRLRLGVGVGLIKKTIKNKKN
jgi:hypothetical protein